MKPLKSSFAARHSRAMTLVEVAIAQVIIGLAIAGVCQLLAAGTEGNFRSSELSRAIHLANDVHELALSLPSAPNSAGGQSLWDLDGKALDPSRGAGAAQLHGWQQRVAVTQYEPGRDQSAAPRIARLRVEVLHNDNVIYTASWLIACAEARAS